VKRIVTFLTLGALFLAACGGGDDDSSTSPATGSTGGSTASSGSGGGGNSISAADADRVAHAALPEAADLPGGAGDWLVTADDDFGSSDGTFLEFIEGNSECETLQNLATLESVFGGDDDDDEPVGQAQREFENQDPAALLPTSLEVKIEVDESAGGSQAAFALVKDLFESDETSNCLISVLNNQFTETGPPGVTFEVKKGSGSASAPQNGARMAFDIEMSVSGIELSMAMRMYFWPYENAQVQVLFLGTNETLTDSFVGDVLKTVDNKVKAAAGG
jgi:hypothetical protein